MHRSPSAATAALVTLLTLAGCGGETTPTEPGAVGDLPAPVTRVDPTGGSESITVSLSNIWASSSPMRPQRAGMAAATVDDIVYVIGGATDGKPLKLAQAFDPATQLWSNLPSLPAHRDQPSGAAVIGRRIYLTGGRDSANVITRTLYMYNTDTKVWRKKRDLPVPSRSGVSATISGKLYVYTPEGVVPGGTAHLHRYDPSANTWTELATPPSGHPYGTGGAINGKFYLVGGAVGGVNSPALHVYDPATNKWQAKGSIPTARFLAAAAVLKGKLWVVGGTNDAEIYDVLQVYNPNTDSWVAKAPMPTKRFSLAMASASGRLYAVGGRNNSYYLIRNEVYLP